MPDSSTDCCPCRLEWRPSCWEAVGVALFWPLAAFALLATRWGAILPMPLQVILLAVSAVAGAWRGLALLGRARRILDLQPRGLARCIHVPPSGPSGPAPEHEQGIEGPAVLHEQWPVTTVRFPACGTTLVFWPDTLCASGRRALRRWARTATPASPLPQFWMG